MTIRTSPYHVGSGRVVRKALINVAEGVGWPVLIHGGIERDRLRREEMQSAANSSMSDD